MISLVSLLSLQAHGATFNVNAGSTLENALLLACQSPGPHTIRLQVDNGAAVLELGPGSVQGNVGVYPPADPSCLPSPPDITIEGAGGRSRIKYLPQLGSADTLLSFGDGANVTLRNLELRGLFTAEVPGDANTDILLRCADGGDTIRGVFHSAGASTDLGSLTIEDVEFRCLDGNQTGFVSSQLGGAVLAQGVPVVVRDSFFEDNSAFEGGAIAVIPGPFTLGAPSNPSLVIERSDFEFNWAAFGGAVSVQLPNHAVIVRDATFMSNLGVNEAGGLNLEAVGAVTIERTVFDRQNPTNFDFFQQGGSVRLVGANGLTFRNNVVCGSWAGEGGGVYASDPGPTDIEGSVFSENGGLCYGGGLYVEAASGEPVRVVNNTFVGNEAGRSPPYLNDPVLCSIGGGGAAAFAGVNPEFRNNVVAYQAYGGGIFGEYIPFTAAPGYQIGDELIFYNNLWFDNNDTVSEGHVTGDFASIAFHQSNLIDENPQLVYLGPGEYNCVPEAFYPQRTSPALNAGGGDVEGGIPGDCQDYVDTSANPDFVHDEPLQGDPSCDIGAFGGRYGLFAKDTDGDGWSNIFDCNDNDANVNPGQPDECDFIDNDCNGIVDDGLAVQWWPDADGDGFGDTNLPQQLSCEAIPGKVSNDLDCDDSNAQKFTGAPEVCNDADDDCDQEIDEELPLLSYYQDLDGDGFGSGLRQACRLPGPEWITTGGDCDESNPFVFPNAPETCGDNVDNNCNGMPDPIDPASINASSYYVDADGDGYGDINIEPIRLCSSEPLEGYVSVGGDCNDADAEVNEGAQERCTVAGDEDCDGDVDEVDGNTLDADRYFQDSDGDGLGLTVSFVYQCSNIPDAPSGFVLDGGDCDDMDPLVGECSECGCQATPQPLQGALGLVLGLAAVLLRRRNP